VLPSRFTNGVRRIWAWDGRGSTESGSEVWRSRGCGSVVIPGRRPGSRGPPDERSQARIAELERLVGRQQPDLDFFREALRSWDREAPRERRTHLFAVMKK